MTDTLPPPSCLHDFGVDVVHAKWLEQLRLVSEKASKAAEAKDADADGRDNGDDLVGEEVKKKKEASTEGGDGVEPEARGYHDSAPLYYCSTHVTLLWTNSYG